MAGSLLADLPTLDDILAHRREAEALLLQQLGEEDDEEHYSELEALVELPCYRPPSEPDAEGAWDNNAEGRRQMLKESSSGCGDCYGMSKAKKRALAERGYADALASDSEDSTGEDPSWLPSYEREECEAVPESEEEDEEDEEEEEEDSTANPLKRRALNRKRDFRFNKIAPRTRAGAEALGGGRRAPKEKQQRTGKATSKTRSTLLFQTAYEALVAEGYGTDARGGGSADKHVRGLQKVMRTLDLSKDLLSRDAILRVVETRAGLKSAKSKREYAAYATTCFEILAKAMDAEKEVESQLVELPPHLQSLPAYVAHLHCLPARPSGSAPLS